MGTLVHTAEQDMHGRAAHVSSCGVEPIETHLPRDALFYFFLGGGLIETRSFSNAGSHKRGQSYGGRPHRR